ncbi:hypothetical protein DSECCO2_575990 [anaerobic digester metagenome]
MAQWRISAATCWFAGSCRAKWARVRSMASSKRAATVGGMSPSLSSSPMTAASVTPQILRMRRPAGESTSPHLNSRRPLPSRMSSATRMPGFRSVMLMRVMRLRAGAAGWRPKRLAACWRSGVPSVWRLPVRSGHPVWSGPVRCGYSVRSVPVQSGVVLCSRGCPVWPGDRMGARSGKGRLACQVRDGNTDPKHSTGNDRAHATGLPCSPLHAVPALPLRQPPYPGCARVASPSGRVLVGTCPDREAADPRRMRVP